ncbi:MAG: ATP-binding cassette domain-containing protein [Proteobacteria bacterium]|nr:ATP-binding cassette domain-containing protein [Pseudomonadota bacterium]
MNFFNRKTIELAESLQRLGGDVTKSRAMPGAMPGGLFDVAVATIFINVLGLATPLALLQVFNRVIPERDQAQLFWLAIGVGSALALEALLRVGRSYVSGWMGARLEHLTGCRVLERLISANIIDFNKRGVGAYLERLNGLGSLREYYSGQASGAIFDLPFVLIYLGVIAFLAGPLVLVPLILICIFAIAAVALKRLGKVLDAGLQADDRRFGFIIEALGGIHTVKGLGMEEQMLRRYERLQESSAETDYQAARLEGAAINVGMLLSGLAVFGVAGFGANMVIAGTLTTGGLLASIILAGRAVQPLQTIAAAWTKFLNARLARQRLHEIFEMPHEKPTGLVQLQGLKGSLDFQGLGFSYGEGKDGEDLPAVFKHINLHIEPGQTIGVVGPSASGKTTLLSLMMGLLTPTAGVARIDGYDLRECDPVTLRHQIAYLPQEAVMFAGTFMENLTMFRDDLAEDARGIAILLGLDNVANSLGQGYDTPIGVGADDKLPRGTRQRIAIARALVDKPRLLLFDEANSFIDGPGDALLLNLLMKLKGRVTLILVTQRPSMLRLSDRIIEIRGDALFEHPMRSENPGAADNEATTMPASPPQIPTPPIPPESVHLGPT